MTPEVFDFGSKYILFLLEAVLQADGAVEDQLIGAAVLIKAEVAGAHELEVGGEGEVLESLLRLTAPCLFRIN